MRFNENTSLLEMQPKWIQILITLHGLVMIDKDFTSN